MRLVSQKWILENDLHIYSYGPLPGGKGEGVREVAPDEIPFIEAETREETGQRLIDKIHEHLDKESFGNELMKHIYWIAAMAIIELIRKDMNEVQEGPAAVHEG